MYFALIAPVSIYFSQKLKIFAIPSFIFYKTVLK